MDIKWLKNDENAIYNLVRVITKTIQEHSHIRRMEKIVFESF